MIRWDRTLGVLTSLAQEPSHMSRFLPPLCLLLLLVAAPAVQADVIDDRAEYGRCMDMARHDPDQGWEEAQHWLGLGGGEAARHCAAIALIGRGKVAEGAQMLEELAGKSHRAAPLRAQMLAQAAESWVMIKDYVHA